MTSSADGIDAFSNNVAVRVNNIFFGNTTGHCMQCAHGAECSIAAIATLNGTVGGSFAIVQTGARFVSDGATISIAGASSVGLPFYFANSLASMFAACMTFVNPLLLTGSKFSVQLNVIINTNGGINYFPGNSAGTILTGGQYN